VKYDVGILNQKVKEKAKELCFQVRRQIIEKITAKMVMSFRKTYTWYLWRRYQIAAAVFNFNRLFQKLSQAVQKS